MLKFLIDILRIKETLGQPDLRKINNKQQSKQSKWAGFFYPFHVHNKASHLVIGVYEHYSINILKGCGQPFFWRVENDTVKQKGSMLYNSLQMVKSE